MEEIKRIDLNEFKNEGFLQEVNRLFFHPLGLALEVIVDEDGNVEKLGGVWDYRDDPEGMFFTNNSLSTDKIERVRKLRESKIYHRKANPYEVEVDENGVQIKQ